MHFLDTMKIGLIKEGKIPADNRVALTPIQCRWIKENKNVDIIVQSSPGRCFSDEEYKAQGIEVRDHIDDCAILLGIKEVPIEMLIPDKIYLFFSHTKKLQPYNQALFRAMMEKNISLIDYECLEHEDGTRLLGFGFFAGVVGAHNGMMAYGNRTGALHLGRVYEQRNFQELVHTYFGLKIPNVRIAVTGSGRVAHGITEVMNLMGIHEAEPDEFKAVPKFDYPVYVHLKGAQLYKNATTGEYIREEFHEYPERYECLFKDYLFQTDILMNGVYWQEGIPRLFDMQDLRHPDYRMHTIADISDDQNGSVPCNVGDATIENPIYGVDRNTGMVTPPYLKNSVDIMSVGNLPNELPRDASRYFGEQIIKFILDDLLSGGSPIIDKATMLKNGKITEDYFYMKEYGGNN